MTSTHDQDRAKLTSAAGKLGGARRQLAEAREALVARAREQRASMDQVETGVDDHLAEHGTSNPLLGLRRKELARERSVLDGIETVHGRHHRPEGA